MTTPKSRNPQLGSIASFYCGEVPKRTCTEYLDGSESPLFRIPLVQVAGDYNRTMTIVRNKQNISRRERLNYTSYKMGDLIK